LACVAGGTGMVPSDAAQSHERAVLCDPRALSTPPCCVSVPRWCSAQGSGFRVEGLLSSC